VKALLIARRDLAGYLRSPAGYIIIAAVLLIDGLLFNVDALGGAAKPSAEVLERFFYFSSGTTMIACVLLSMRLLAEERQTGTLTLLFTSPVRESEIVFGKYLSALALFAGMTLLTLYMPALIFVNGKVSIGHIVSGYVGLLLLGSATLAIGIFGSSLAKSQVLAAVVSAAIVVTMLLFWLIGQAADPPFKEVFAALALHNRRFLDFQRGIVELGDVVYYLSVTYVFLLATTKVLESRRWR
jgi:gliding motility-associated transport system permease protein